MAEEELLMSLQLRGWYLKDITIVEELLQEVSTEKPSRVELEKMIEANLLEMDLKVVGGKCLPDAAALHRISRLQGPKVLQIVSIRNIRQSSDRAMVPSQQKDGRLLQICLTDGHSTITAIEYCPLPSISEDMAPGTKVCFEGIASVKSGILLLESRSLNVLGGYVQSLYEEWEIERKYSIFSRSSLNSSQVQGSSGPPPFERLNIEISPVQSCHKAELQVHKSYGCQRVMSQRDKPIASKLTNESTGTDFMEQGTASVKPGGKLPDTSTYQVKDNAGSLNNGSITTERVRTGYEVYRPKASQHKPVESLQLCAKSLEKASICSDKETNLLTGNQKPKFSEPEIKSTDVKTTNMPVELRKNEILEGGQPGSINRKMNLGADSIPIQNQAASQKLLKKMSDKVPRPSPADFLRDWGATVVNVDWEGKVALIQCAKAMGIQKFVFYSIHNCDKHPEVPLMEIKRCTEKYLQESGLNYTIIRLCGFMQGLIGQYAVPILEDKAVWGTDAPTRIAYMDTQDIARMTLTAIRNEKTDKKFFTFAGPRAWTTAEVISLCERLAGQDANVTTVPVGVLRFTRQLTRLFQWTNDVADRLAFSEVLSSDVVFSTPMAETYSLLGVDPNDTNTLERYLQEYFTSILKKLKELKAQSKQGDFYI